jgi:hypothetical protein
MARKIIIKESQFRKLILNEYLDKNWMAPIMHYFQMSEEDKKSDLVWEYPYRFYDYIEDHLLGMNERYPELVKSFNEGNIDESDLPQMLLNKYPKVFHNYGSWLYNLALNGYLDDENPSFMTMQYMGLFKNGWLIHFSDDACTIAREGFTKGSDDMNFLSLTYGKEKYSEGYNFAYDIDDFDKYAHGKGHGTGFRYGDEAVMFRASGIKVWHSGDEEPQVIFYGPMAKDYIYINYEYEDHTWQITSPKTDRVLFSSEDLKTVTDWVQNNGRQYMNAIGIKEY